MHSGRELTLYLDEVPASLDGLTTESFAQWTVVYNLTDRLIEFGPHGELVGNLASSWDRDADLPGHWIFRLRKDRKFHDGTEVTARDVVDSLKLAVADSLGYGAAGHFFSSDGVFATDDGCVVIRAQSDSRALLEQLNMNAFGIRKSGATGPLYSGAWKFLERGADFLRLGINPTHPSASSNCYDTVIIRKVPSQANEVKSLLTGRDQVILGRNGLLFSAENLPSDARLFSLASGNSHVLSLRPETPHLDWIRSSIHQIMFSGQVLKKLSYARPLNSFFPPGFVVNAPVFPRTPRRPEKPVVLEISVSVGMADASWLHAMKRELREYGILAEFSISDSWEGLGPGADDSRDGFIAACYLDIQDPVRLAGHYFSGPRSAVGELPSDLSEKISAASLLEPGLERDRLIRAFFEGVIRDTPCIPLFFAPTVVVASSDVSLADIEYFGNTLKFSGIRKGKTRASGDAVTSLDLRMFAHDVKRPFSLIKAASQLIEAADSIEDVRKISESLLPQVIKAVASVDGMVKDLLSPESANREEVSPLNSCISMAIEQVTANRRDTLGPHGIASVEFFGVRPDICIRGDCTSTERIFANLIQNALEAAPPGARVWVRIAESQSDKEVVIGVGNEGSYISPEIQQSLFQVGFSKKGTGRGLGLSIVQNLVQRAGGSISVNSGRDSGTEFLVALPIQTNFAVPDAALSCDEFEDDGLQSREVILVEDDPFIVDAWEMVWRKYGITVFRSPEDLFAARQNDSLVVTSRSVIVTDYLFHGSSLTGRDVLEWARRNSAGIVILASDYDDIQMKSLVDLIIEKGPLAPDQLFRMLKKK
jgi:signal transduction histidine kinase